MNLPVLFFLTVIFYLGAFPSIASIGLSIVPQCLAGFCLEGNSLPTEAAVIERFGNSRQRHTIINTISHCYQFVSADKEVSYGYFEFKKQNHATWQLVTLRVSRISLCAHPNAVHISSGLLTKEGLSLESDKAELYKLYGKPTYVIKKPSELIIRDFYNDQSGLKIDIICQYVSSDDKDLASARFYFSENKLIGIEISVDE